MRGRGTVLRSVACVSTDTDGPLDRGAATWMGPDDDADLDDDDDDDDT